MNKLFTLILLPFFFIDIKPTNNQFIARQGQVTFLSYTSVENIEAQNNQVLSIIDIKNNEIAISMLMRAFVFKKQLMHEHFNESYVESDIYPKATFQGKILEFDSSQKKQIKIVKGNVTIHGITKEISIKTTITKENKTFNLKGNFSLTVKDFDIKIPPILASNIAKNIAVQFNFEYQPYEE